MSGGGNPYVPLHLLRGHDATHDPSTCTEGNRYSMPYSSIILIIAIRCIMYGTINVDSFFKVSFKYCCLDVFI